MNLYINFKTMNQFIFTLLLLLATHHFNCHYIEHIEGEEVSIDTYTNQAYGIEIPFHKCFKVQTELQANEKYVLFEPSTLSLRKKGEGKVSENNEISLIQNIRSSQSIHHKNLLVFKDYMIAFLPPQKVQIIKGKSQFEVDKTFEISQINYYSEFKMYKFKEKGLLVLYTNSRYKKNRLFLISEAGYQIYEMPNDHSIAYLIEHQNGFYAAQYHDGVSYYQFPSNSNQNLIIKANYGEIFNSSTLYIVDININHLKTKNIIYALDGKNGLYRISLELPSHPSAELIIKQKNCKSFDSIEVDHVVLVCQIMGSSSIIEVYGSETEEGVKFENSRPQYHLNYFNDLDINKNYYMVFSHKVLNVYWNSRSNNIPETVDTQSQLDLPGLQTFFLSLDPSNQTNSFLYTIQSGLLIKYAIAQSQAKLKIKSSNPVSMSFNLSIFGNCNDIKKEGGGDEGSRTCELEKEIHLNVVEDFSPRKEDFSVSASIVVILIVVFLLIIWICLKKYKGLEREARKVLEAYKKKKPTQKYAL